MEDSVKFQLHKIELKKPLLPPATPFLIEQVESTKTQVKIEVQHKNIYTINPNLSEIDVSPSSKLDGQ